MLHKKINNVRYALSGLYLAWQEEFSFRVQVVAMLLALLFGAYFGITTTEWLFLFLTISFVLSAEVFNTALEELCDKYKADPDPHIGKIKDLAAAAVLIASFVALIVGAIIFIPYLAALS
ncbi:hypothetical protein A2763_02420 [Candidatus Kaiserbacteria bacterium RIFCSPHIGHO2_01_FULL_54_36]|uniref:Diacylglycerol kinase n=1 Tax=Candidatus Kaiserbacteria bacterium RIFCSPHIGHO2_01_FULL_54_36 TaxID=1798482 RepID=A0A1F6CNI6_9BACT|nr:MAG: hypothetical protein A2763_02420 [Candidatus Kaiserbacteria bacterium RIFCSPHIGHO2_01_FULL_54_36]OGG76014.1 MAG: hypothetical protein A3A41_03525 [Candidatus Kaiserbacteria bacterium RIFCSPLOWO2_01_FULL_54_22]